jgi:hypothetical protein
MSAKLDRNRVAPQTWTGGHGAENELVSLELASRGSSHLTRIPRSLTIWLDSALLKPMIAPLVEV